MNGRQLAEIARTHRPGLKVLFTTGYAENVSLRSDQLPAKTKVIAKPFVLDALATTVRDMIVAH